MTQKTSPRSSSRSTSNGSEGATTPAGGVLPPLPVDSFKEAAPHLRRPFAENAVKFKVQTGTMVVPYVDARSVIERLNLVVPHLWTAEYESWGERVDSNLLVCHLTIDGLTRSDIGKGSQTEAQKGAYSDALKRAAVHFGVGVSLYAMSKVFLSSGTGSKDEHGIPTLKPDGKTKNNKDKFKMTPEAERWLRSNYAAWLETDRGRHFGESLDHGDSPDAIGDPDEAPGGDEPAPEGPEISAKRQEAEKIYSEIPAAKRPKLPPQRFKHKLASCDNGQVDEFIAELKELANA